MAIQAKLLEITMPTGSSGNIGYTGAGFQPQVVLFFGTEQTAWGFTDGGKWCFGAATASTERWCQTWFSVDNSTDDQGQAISNNKVIWWDTVYNADFVSMDADGFTLNHPSAWPGGYLVKALCLGGMTDAYVGLLSIGQATGTVATTAPGFQPDLLITTMPSRMRSDSYNTEFAAGGFGIGAADGTNEFCTNVKTHYYITESVCNTHIRNDKLWSCTTHDADTLVSAGNLSSFDTNGFTLNRTTNGVDGLDRVFPYIAIKSGGSVTVGSFDAQTGTGTFTVTPGFNPKALLACSTFQSTAFQTAPATSDGEWGFGVGDGTNQWGFWGFSKDALATIDSASRTSTTNFLQNYNRTAADTYAAEGEIAISDLTTPSNGFTLNQSDADGSAFKIMYIAVGDTPAAGGAGGHKLAGKLYGKLSGKV